MTGVATRGSEISFGEYGLKCLEPAWITDRQIEAARIAMTRHIKRGGKIWIRMFPDQNQVCDPRRSRRRRDLVMKKREELDKYRDLPEDELRAEAARLRESLFRLKFKLALGEVDAVKRIRQEKKSLARIETLTRQRITQTQG